MIPRRGLTAEVEKVTTSVANSTSGDATNGVEAIVVGCCICDRAATSQTDWKAAQTMQEVVRAMTQPINFPENLLVSNVSGWNIGLLEQNLLIITCTANGNVIQTILLGRLVHETPRIVRLQLTQKIEFLGSSRNEQSNVRVFSSPDLDDNAGKYTENRPE